MASLSSTVALVFQLDDQASKQIQAIEGRLSAFGKSVSNVADPIANATAALIAFEKAILLAAGVLASEALQAYAKVELATVGLTKALGELNEQELAGAKDAIATLAREFGISTVDVTNSVADFAKAGFELEDSLGIARVALDQAIAAEVDLASATESLKVVQIAYGLDVDTLRLKLDSLNTVADRSKLNSEQLLDAVSRTAQAASAAGFSFEELIANLTPIVEATQQGTESGTAFRTLLVNLTKPTEVLKEEVAKLGNEQLNQALASGDAKKAFELLIPSLQGTDENTRKMVLAQAAGAEQFNRILPLLTGAETKQRAYADALDASNTIAEEAARVLDTLAKRYDSLQVSISQVFSAIGAGFVGGQGAIGIEDVVNSLEELAVAAQKAFSSQSFDTRVFSPVRDVLADINEIILQVSDNLGPAFEKADLSGFERALNALFGDLKDVEISVDDLAGVIEFLSDTFGSLTVVTTEAEKFFIGPLLTGITTVTSAFNSLDEDVKRIVGATGGIALLIKLLGTGPAALLGTITLIQQNKDFLSDVFGFDVDVEKWINFLVGGLNNIVKIIKDLDFIDKLITQSQVTESVTALELLQKNYGLTADSAEEAKQILGTFGEILRDVDASAGDTSWEAYVDSLGQVGGRGESAKQSLEDLAATFNLIKSVSGPEAANLWAVAALGAENATAIWNKSLDNLANKGPNIADVFGSFGTAVDSSTQKITTSEERLKQFLITADDGSKVLTNLGQAGLNTFTDTNQAIDASGKQFTDYVKTTKLVGGELVTFYEETDKTLKTTFSNTSKSIDDATKKSEDFQLKLLELASNEKIKTIEATVQLNIAQIEADTARVEAAFNSINTAIESTGGTIEAAFGALGEFAELSEIDLSRNQAFQAILDQLAAENALRQQAFEDQTRLNDAIIDNLRAKTAAFDRGDPLIKIDGTGLEPELRAIMWYMLRAIQVQVNAEFADFLLGLNPDLPPAAPA